MDRIAEQDGYLSCRMKM